uniref:WUSCHEL homeobox protein WOX8D n=1 Tax=Picea abies TaxID=3329 RepID=R9R867_PICAB|nr:WUSCHEL homeobox protein WOX8D [Picea abies]
MTQPYSEGALSRSVPNAKSRWHPKPEQIQILEAIFNSGMVNPTRKEIKIIRAQLEEFGQVGDVNVFYWFQNRKARSKRKRQLQDAQKSKCRAKGAKTTSSTASTSAASTSTSVQSKPITTGNHPRSSSAVPVFSFSGNHYDLQVNQEMSNTQFSNMQAIGGAVTTGSNGILNEGGMWEDSISNADPIVTVFINDIPTEVPNGPINFRAFFGDDALLLHSSGQLVLVNEWGFTSEGLEHGATYFLPTLSMVDLLSLFNFSLNTVSYTFAAKFNVTMSIMNTVSYTFAAKFNVTMSIMNTVSYTFAAKFNVTMSIYT